MFPLPANSVLFCALWWQPMFSALELFALAFKVPIFNEVGYRG
jgi:hypothetical protein